VSRASERNGQVNGIERMHGMLGHELSRHGQYDRSVQSQQADRTRSAVRIKAGEHGPGIADLAGADGRGHSAGELHAGQLAGHHRLGALKEQLAQLGMIWLSLEVRPNDGAGVRVQGHHRAERSASSASLTAVPNSSDRTSTSSQLGTSAGGSGT